MKTTVYQWNIKEEIHIFHKSMDQLTISVIFLNVLLLSILFRFPRHSNRFLVLNTFKYHVPRTDGKISVRIIYFYYLFLRRPTHYTGCDRRNEYEVWLIGTRPRRVSNHSKALLPSWYDGTPSVI